MPYCGWEIIYYWRVWSTFGNQIYGQNFNEYFSQVVDAQPNNWTFVTEPT